MPLFINQRLSSERSRDAVTRAKFGERATALWAKFLRMGNETGIRKLANQHIIKWVEEQAALCRPDTVFWCDGSEEEKNVLTRAAVETGVLIELNQ